MPIMRPIANARGSGQNAQPLGAASSGTSDAAARQDHVHPVRFAMTIGGANAPVNNADVTVEFTSNTVLTFKGKGSDGTIRSATLTLA